MDIEDPAQELLELTAAQAEARFDPSNTIDQLLQIVPQIIEGQTPRRCPRCDHWHGDTGTTRVERLRRSPSFRREPALAG